MPEVNKPAPQKKSENLPAPHKPVMAEGGDTIARLLVKQGLITPAKLIYAKRIKAKLVSDRSLVEIFKELGLLTNQQLNEVLKQQRLNILIGDLLVELGFIWTQPWRSSRKTGSRKSATSWLNTDLSMNTA